MFGDLIISISEQILQFSISKVVTGSELDLVCAFWSKMKTINRILISIGVPIYYNNYSLQDNIFKKMYGLF